MKPILYPTLLALTMSGIGSQAQTKATWGDEFKMNKKSTDLAVLAVDKTGEYLEESHEEARMFRGYHKSSELVKLSPQLTEVYRNDFDKELRGKDFEQFMYIQDKLWMFATVYDKHERTTVLFAAEVDKNTGKLVDTWNMVNKWQKEEKNEALRFRIKANDDSTKIILTATYEGKETNRYELQALDPQSLKPIGQLMGISNEFDPKTYQVEDFVYTSTGNAVVVGRIFDYPDGEKKKAKNLQFKSYNIRIYEPSGKLIKEIATDVDNKYFMTSKLMQVKGELVLAAFYCNDKKRKEVNGMIVERVDPTNGNILMTTKKELNASSITQIDDEEADKKSLKKTDGDDDDGLSANLRFNRFYITPDNGLLILAERYHNWIVTSTSYGGSMGMTSTTTYDDYESGDIYMTKINTNGQIDWMHVLPKSQFESIILSSSMGPSVGFSMSYYFKPESGRPFYSGYGSIATQNHVHLYFNDREENGDILEPGHKIKTINNNFNKTAFYEIDLDMTTGKYTRRMLFSNRDVPNAMPRLGVVLNGTMYVTGKEGRKTAVGKLEVKE